jgi:NAD(P)-dependent dehydrogenase (short-subunit alcohol dehydrogenase family)
MSSETVSKPMLRTFQDAVVVITGGASGIGRALGEELARRGAQVVLADLQSELASEVAEKIQSAGGKASAVSLDVTDYEAVKTVIEHVATSAGRLDYLFNNAGIVIGGEARAYGIDDWTRVLDVNLGGVVNGVQAAYAIMCRQGFGHIVNTASIAGLIPITGLLSYSTSKHAVVGLSTSLRAEAAPYGVRVSVLCPGAVDTPIAGGGKFGKVLQGPPPELMRRLWERQRPISPERFARKAVAAVARNRAIIVIPWRWRLLWWVYRISPTLALTLVRRQHLSVKKIIEEATQKASG